jgi:hypothetical protein
MILMVVITHTEMVVWGHCQLMVYWLAGIAKAGGVVDRCSSHEEVKDIMHHLLYYVVLLLWVQVIREPTQVKGVLLWSHCLMTTLCCCAGHIFWQSVRRC